MHFQYNEKNLILQEIFTELEEKWHNITPKWSEMEQIPAFWEKLKKATRRSPSLLYCR